MWIVALLLVAAVGAPQSQGEPDPGALPVGTSVDVQVRHHSDLFAELQQSDPGEAVRHARQAVELLGKIPEPKRAADLLIRLGDFLMYREEFEAALDCATEALSMSESASYAAGISGAHLLAGTLNGRRGQLKQALIHGAQAEQAALPLEKKQHLARAYSLMAIVRSMVGDYGEAEELNLKAIEIQRVEGNKQALARSYNNLGIVYYKRLNYGSAIESYGQTLAIYRELDDQRQIARSLNNIGVVHLDLKAYDEALSYFNESLEIKKEFGNSQDIASTLANIGQIHAAQKNLEVGLDYYQRAQSIHTDLGNKRGQALGSKDIGRLYRLLGQYDKAQTELERALEQCGDLGLKPMIGVILQELSLTHEALGESATALDYYRRYKFADDALFEANRVDDVADMRTRHDWNSALLELDALREQKRLQAQVAKRDRRLRNAYSICAVLLALLLLVVAGFYRMNRRAHSTLQEAHANLQESHTKLEEANDTLRRQRDELTEAAETIQALRGLLPLCASCKKVRDDEGYWQQIEIYLRDSTGAQVTHGLCPDCIRDLYGEDFLAELNDSD